MNRRQKRTNYSQRHNMNNMNQYNDPFQMDNDDFGFGIHDDFDDPF